MKKTAEMTEIVLINGMDRCRVFFLANERFENLFGMKQLEFEKV